MAPVNIGKFHATSRSHFTTWWIIEVWEDGVESPVFMHEQANRPNHIDKRNAIQRVIQGRKNGEIEKAKWEEDERRQDEEEARRYRK